MKGNEMSEKSSKKSVMAKDTVVYMLAKGSEGIIGILTLSTMTRLFHPDDMGMYSVINIFATTVAMLCIQWLVQSSLRYINKYDVEGENEAFYSTAFLSWLRVNLFVALLGASFILFAGIFFSKSEFLHNYTVLILSFALIMFICYNSCQLVISMLAAKRHTKTNLCLSVVNITGKLFVILILCKAFGNNIIWVFVSYSILDAVCAVLGFCKLEAYKYIKLNKYSEEISKTLRAYGTPLIWNMFATSLLNKSDVYIITGFLGKADAGIYQTNYSIVASAFTMLQTAVMRGSYPTILRTWSEGKKRLTENLVSEAVRMFLLLAIPAVLGVFALSDFMAEILFDKEYWSGHTVMPFVAFGMLFLGLSEYAIKPYELNADTKSIFYRSMLGGAVNVLLNLILLKRFGYFTAAVTTLIGYFVYFLSVKIGTRKMLKWNLKFKNYFNLIFSGLVMALILIVIKSKIPHNIITLFVSIVLGGVVYFAVLYLTGEIKNEVHSAMRKLGVKRV